MSSNLVLHVGAKPVTPEELRSVITPAADGGWVPIPHHELAESVERTLSTTGLRVVEQRHGLTPNGARYFGLMLIEGGADYRLAVGIRNSHDRSWAAELLLGSNVFVCDNTAFHGDAEQVGRKHTTHIRRDLPALIDAAVGRLTQRREGLSAQIASYKRLQCDDRDAAHLLMQAYDARVVSTRSLDKVWHEWRQPRHEDFKPRTGWSLFNAFTEVLKEYRIFDRPRQTQALHGLFDARVAAVAK